jgi:hypothetical protein
MTRRPRASYSEFHPSFPFLDVLLMLVVLLLARHHKPASLDRTLRPPNLVVGTGPAPAAKPGRANHEIMLHRDGRVTFQGDALRPGELAARLVRDPEGRTRAVRLVVDTGPDGSGAIESYLQLQTDLSRAGLWQNIEIIYRTPERDAPPRRPETSP